MFSSSTLLISTMWLSYLLPIWAVYTRYDSQRHHSISAVLCDEWVWRWSMTGLLLMSFFTILYESAYSSTSFYSILSLLFFLVLLLTYPVSEDCYPHYACAGAVVLSILVWMYHHSGRWVWALQIICVLLIVCVPSVFFQAEVAFLILFASAYMKRHNFFVS